jgi:hypothetical protein
LFIFGHGTYTHYFTPEITAPELLDAIAEAKTGGRIDIYEYLEPDLIDITTDSLSDFIDSLYPNPQQ